MVEYINKLTSDEFSSFEKFIYSPYFNTNRNLIKLFEYLRPAYPNITDDYFSKFKLSINIYNEKKVNEVKIRKLISDFSLVLEKFLTQSEIENDEIGNRLCLLRSLRKKGLYKRFEMEIKDIYKVHKSKFSKDDKYYLNQINLESEYYYYYFSKFKLEFAECLQKKSNSIDYYFIFTKLHNFHEMFFNEANKNKSFKKNFFNEIIDYINANKDIIYKEHPNIFIIYLVMMMYNTLDDNYLKELLNYLKINEKKFAKESLSYYYHYIRSYYIHKINLGHIQYRKDAFEIFKKMKDRSLFLIDNMITDLEFNSVIYIALSLNEYNWLNEFIEEYREFLDKNYAKDAYNLAKAKLLYEKKDYQSTFNHLNEVEFKDPNYYYHSKFIMARVYYEMKNINGLLYIISNLKQYIRTKNLLSSEQVTAIKTFNKYMIELIKVLESNSKEKKSLQVILKKELDNEKNIVPKKSWFYEKLSEV